MKKCLLILSLFISLSVFADAGDSFDNPILIESAGTITFPESKDNLYYSFTLTDSAVVILSEHADYYTTVYDSQGSSVDYGYSGEQKYHLASDTYIIYVESYINGSFDWTLTQREAFLGEFEYLPITITESGKIGIGENTNRAYYSFTPETDGVICFENVDKIGVDVHEKDAYDNLFDYNSNYRLSVNKGTEYIFFLNSQELISYEWDFIFANEQGSVCSNPILIDGFGTITSSVGAGTKYFKFTSSKTDLIVIKSLQSASGNSGAKAKYSDAGFKLFSGCGYSDDSYLAWSNNGIIKYEASANEELIIEYKNDTENYTNEVFSFTVLPNSTIGGSCLSPIVLESPGEVTFPSEEDEQYYAYTATKNGKLILSDADSDHHNINYGTDCSADLFSAANWDGELSIDATAGVTYIFKWEASQFGEFKWTLTERDFTEGEACSNPIVVTPGSIDFDAAEGILFYSYTAEKNGMVQITDASYSNNLKVMDACNSSNNPNYGDDGSLEFECIKDETYIIAWENTSDEIFQWAFTVRDADLGEACTNPIEITSVGDASAPTELTLPKAAQYKHVYFSYTAASDQVLIISDDSKSCDLAITQDCSFGFPSFGSNGELAYEVKSGTNYIIRWLSNYPYDIPWTIYARDIIPGESMASAIEITSPGDVAGPADLAQIYYKYTPDTKTVVSATTTEDKPYSYYLNKLVDAGETAYITWFNNDKTAFTWTLEERDAMDGEFCSTAIEITTPGDIVTNTSLSTIYYSFKATKKSILTITDNDGEHAATLTKGCSGYSYYFSNTNGEIAAEALTNEQLIVRWDLDDNTEFTWNISEATPLIGETLENPIVIAEPGQIDVIGIDKHLVYSYYSYTPSEDQKVEISAGDYVMIIDGTSKDTLEINYKSTTLFKASKDKTYLIVWGLGYNKISSFNLSATSEGKNNISFKVSDGFASIKGASIVINETTLTTNSEGVANISLAHGTYTYTVSASPFVEQTGEITVSGFDYNVTSVLAKPDEQLYTVTFNFTDADGPISDGFVIINNTTISADSETSVSIELVDGTYAYTASTLYHANTEGEVVVAGADQEVTVFLVPGEEEKYTLKFIVDDGTNKVENASITINETTIVTDGNGEATIELGDGGYAYEITATGFGKQTGTIYVDGKDLNEMVTLIPASSESYQVVFTVNGNSAAIEGASVAINDSTIISNTEGVAIIELQNGTYNYTVSATGFQAYTQQITISDADANIQVDLIAEGEETYIITFNVKNGTNNIEGATISINNTEIVTNSEGIATITVVDGTYNYTISATDFENNSGEVIVDGANKEVAIELTKTVGIYENKLSVSVYPNPASSTINVKTEETIERIQVYSITGNLLKQQAGFNESFSIADLNTGVYLLKVSCKNNSEFIRFIKE